MFIILLWLIYFINLIESICLTLPNNITKEISTHENNEQYIINFLQNALPSSDMGSIADELRKVRFLLEEKIKK